MERTISVPGKIEIEKNERESFKQTYRNRIEKQIDRQTEKHTETYREKERQLTSTWLYSSWLARL